MANDRRHGSDQAGRRPASMKRGLRLPLRWLRLFCRSRPKTCLYEERIETPMVDSTRLTKSWPKTCLYEERIETPEVGLPLEDGQLGRRPASMKRGLRPGSGYTPRDLR